MLSSICPLGERARNSRWWVTAAAYLLGSTVGGLGLGAGAGLVGTLLPASWRHGTVALLVGAALLMLGFLLDLRVGGIRLPAWRRQVDERWLARYRGWVYGLGFGAQLGFGLVTIVTSATTYAMVVLCLLAGVPDAILVGGVFGLVRALPSLLVARARRPADLHRVFARLEEAAPGADLAARVTLAAGATALVITAVGS